MTVTKEAEETKLSFVTLTDDNRAILLNGDDWHRIALPKNIEKKRAEDRRKIIEGLIFDGCDKYNFDYVGLDNVAKHAKEVVDDMFGRTRAEKKHNNNNISSPPSDPRITIAYKDDYFEYLVSCVKKTVKEENALIRQILYALLSAYSNDPINLAVLAPTSTGKTYPILEAAKYGPISNTKEIRKVGSMTPKVLVREKGILIDKDMHPIGAEVRKLRNAKDKAKREKNYAAVEVAKTIWRHYCITRPISLI